MRYENDADYMSTYDRRERSPGPSMSTIAPAYGAYNKSARNSVIAPSEVETVVEHEHHHVHHHIDHGNMQIARPRSNYGAYDDVEDDRSVSRTVVSRSGRERDTKSYHSHKYRTGGSTRYARSEVDITVNNSSSRRGSVQQQPREGTSDWTVVDVPPGTRRITVDIAPQPEPEPEPEVVTEVCREVNVSRYNGIRRSKGVSSELWTEITKDLVCREAIEDMQLAFEETDFFYYIFEYLNKDQINELVELSAAIRRERAKELEYNHIARSHTHQHTQHTHVVEHSHVHATPRYIEALPPPPPPVQEHPEIVYTEEQTRRKSRKYYY